MPADVGIAVDRPRLKNQILERSRILVPVLVPNLEVFEPLQERGNGGEWACRGGDTDTRARATGRRPGRRLARVDAADKNIVICGRCAAHRAPSGSRRHCAKAIKERPGVAIEVGARYKASKGEPGHATPRNSGLPRALSRSRALLRPGEGRGPDAPSLPDKPCCSNHLRGCRGLPARCCPTFAEPTTSPSPLSLPVMRAAYCMSLGLPRAFDGSKGEDMRLEGNHERCTHSN
mmetsp:Transcript_13919/g.44137  ORF Transcript_13919/g.44137 Transcript_13919/m.44137 type:complete len:233 (-) Transcript_13919:46-744(-)